MAHLEAVQLTGFELLVGDDSVVVESPVTQCLRKGLLNERMKDARARRGWGTGSKSGGFTSVHPQLGSLLWSSRLRADITAGCSASPHFSSFFFKGKYYF